MNCAMKFVAAANPKPMRRVSCLLSLGFWWPLYRHRRGYRHRALSVEPLVDLPLAPFRVEVWHLPRFAHLAWAQHHHGREGNDSNTEQNEADQHQHGADLRHREQSRIGEGSRRRSASPSPALLARKPRLLDEGRLFVLLSPGRPALVAPAGYCSRVTEQRW